MVFNRGKGQRSAISARHLHCMLGALSRAFSMLSSLSVSPCVKEIVQEIGEFGENSSRSQFVLDAELPCNSASAMGNCSDLSRKKKGAQTQIFCIRISSGGVGGAKKFSMSLEAQGKQAIWWHIPGFRSRRCPKSLRKKSSCS